MSEMQYAGEFHLVKSKLYTTKGDPKGIDISKVLIDVQIFEDILSNAITGIIILEDTGDILNNAPIVGQEKLSLTLRTPYESPQRKTTIKLEVSIFKIISIQKINTNSNLVTLAFTSHEAIKNGKMRISKSYKGDPAVNITEILRSDMKSKKRLEVELTQNNQIFVIPNMRPFEAINVLAKRCYGVYGPSYLFFETTKGYRFKSFEQMLNVPETIQTEYTDAPVNAGMDTFAALHSVKEYEIISSFDTFGNQRKGMFSSNLITINTYNKSISKNDFDYDADTDWTLGGVSKGLLMSGTADDDGKTLSEHPNAVLQIESIDDIEESDASYTIEDKTPYTSQTAVNWLQQEQSKLAQIQSGIKVRLKVFGQTSLEAGDVISLNFTRNKLINGKYIIVSLKHSFNIRKASHECLMEVVKDYVKDDLPSATVPNNDSGTSETIQY